MQQYFYSSVSNTNMQQNKFGLGRCVRVCIIDDTITVATKTSFLIPQKKWKRMFCMVKYTFSGVIE